MMPFNKFVQQLNNRGIDKQVAYMLTVLCEQQIELGKQLDACASIIEQMANSMQGLVALNARTQEGLEILMKRNQMDGVDVASVANDPEDTEH